MSTEYLDIPNCPKCFGGHRYKLEVERSIVIKMMTMSDLNEPEEPERKVKVTRIFTCPTKNEEYQARFVLTDTSSNRIKNVKVIGLENDDK